jgi:Na+-driven multidrug efflux pump
MADSVARIRHFVLALALPSQGAVFFSGRKVCSRILGRDLAATSIAALGLGRLLVLITPIRVSGLSVGANVIVTQLWRARHQQGAGEAAWHFLGLSLGLSFILAGLGRAGNQ